MYPYDFLKKSSLIFCQFQNQTKNFQKKKEKKI